MITYIILSCFVLKFSQFDSLLSNWSVESKFWIVLKWDIIFILLESIYRLSIWIPIENSFFTRLIHREFRNYFSSRHITNSGEIWKNFEGRWSYLQRCLQCLLIAVEVFLLKDTRWRISDIRAYMCIRAAILCNVWWQHMKRIASIA